MIPCWLPHMRQKRVPLPNGLLWDLCNLMKPIVEPGVFKIQRLENPCCEIQGGWKKQTWSCCVLTNKKFASKKHKKKFPSWLDFSFRSTENDKNNGIRRWNSDRIVYKLMWLALGEKVGEFVAKNFNHDYFLLVKISTSCKRARLDCTLHCNLWRGTSHFFCWHFSSSLSLSLLLSSELVVSLSDELEEDQLS